VAAPPRPAGRKGVETATPIQSAAIALGVPVLTPARLRDPDTVADILALRPALVILADYGQIVPPPLLDLPHGALNLHPSLLPRHRGASPVPATILAGDEETGVTLMRMDAGLDTGPVVAVRRVALAGDETAPELETRLAALAADLLAESLGSWLAGDLVARPQPDAGATLTRPLRRDDGRLDPTRPARELERQVRAYQPWPGSWFEAEIGRVTVWRAQVAGAYTDADADADVKPGTIVERGLVTADGLLALVEVQPAGGRRMPWSAFVRGRRGVVGSTVLPAVGPSGVSGGSPRPTSD
jgi:methionyl-tRNA formyltransferase